MVGGPLFAKGLASYCTTQVMDLNLCMSWLLATLLACSLCMSLGQNRQVSLPNLSHTPGSCQWHCIRGHPETMLSPFSWVWLFATLWTVAHQALLSMGFPRQEYWSGVPFLPPGDLPNPGMESASLMSPALAGGFFFFLPLAPAGKPGNLALLFKPQCPSMPKMHGFHPGNTCQGFITLLTQVWFGC